MYVRYTGSLRIGFRGGKLSNVHGSISSLVQTAGNLALMYFGVMQDINNDITLGSMMAFMTQSGYFADAHEFIKKLPTQCYFHNMARD